MICTNIFILLACYRTKIVGRVNYIYTSFMSVPPIESLINMTIMSIALLILSLVCGAQKCSLQIHTEHS